MDPDQRYDPMDAVFPKVTKCTFHMYGPSGTIQRHDALCILALNIISEKIFVFLWFWFVLLAMISARLRFTSIGRMIPTVKTYYKL